MLTIKIEIDVENGEEAQLTLEHIGSEIAQGYASGIGWSVSGEPEETEN